VGKFWGITKEIALNLKDGLRLEALTANEVIKSFRRIRDVDLKHKSLVTETVSVSIRRG
jgi:hypothetical protein